MRMSAPARARNPPGRTRDRFLCLSGFAPGFSMIRARNRATVLLYRCFTAIASEHFIEICTMFTLN